MDDEDLFRGSWRPAGHPTGSVEESDRERLEAHDRLETAYLAAYHALMRTPLDADSLDLFLNAVRLDSEDWLLHMDEKHPYRAAWCDRMKDLYRALSFGLGAHIRRLTDHGYTVDLSTDLSSGCTVQISHDNPRTVLVAKRTWWDGTTTCTYQDERGWSDDELVLASLEHEHSDLVGFRLFRVASLVRAEEEYKAAVRRIVRKRSWTYFNDVDVCSLILEYTAGS
jgi:hypothetical protein